MELAEIAPDAYVRDVLPHSSALWADGRTQSEYVADFHELVASPFGKRRFRTVGLMIDGALASSAKRYEREVRCGERYLRAVGIGAVFTPPASRGRGYASALIGALLDAERANGTDLAYLFSDIHPAFYERLGFIALPSRAISLRADALPSRRMDVVPITDADWSAVRRCFDTLDDRRAIAFRRTPLVWDWLRLHARSRKPDGQRIELLVRKGRGAVAYALGRRYPRTDTFALDEYAFTGDDGFDAIPALLRSAAGDLRRIAGWLPPEVARTALPRGAVKKRRSAVTMFAPLSTAARTAWRDNAAQIMGSNADCCWSRDHI